jgi:hypothetical protein
MTYSKTLKLNQRFETYDEFLSVFNIENKKNFDIWTKFDCKKQPDGTTGNQEPLIFRTGNQKLSIFPDFPEK